MTRTILPVATDTPETLLAAILAAVEEAPLPTPYRALQPGRMDATGAVVVTEPWSWQTWRCYAKRALSAYTPSACRALLHSAYHLERERGAVLSPSLYQRLDALLRATDEELNQT